MRRWAWLYAALFLFVVVLGYIPGLTNDKGELLGLFVIELHDDALHLASALWAAVAAWLSAKASARYFQIFGVAYGLDGLLGLLTGYGYLDGGIFLHGEEPVALMTRIFANLPHIVIGATAVLIGYVLINRYARQEA